MLGLMLCCCLEILNNFLTRALPFHFALGPTNYGTQKGDILKFKLIASMKGVENREAKICPKWLLETHPSYLESIG